MCQKLTATLFVVDMTEHNRLNVQHEMLKIKLGGLFLQPRAVQRALVPRNGSIPAVLDVGSGSGSWVLDMGEMFPHAEIGRAHV